MRLHRENQDLLAQWVDQYGIDCGYRRKGSFAVGIDSAEEEILRRSRLQMEQDGFPCTFLEASEINSSIGGSSFFGGIFNPSDGVVDPVRLVRGLAAAAETSGTRIFERSPVEGIVREGGAWTARTPRGCVSAPLLFLAANAWVPSLRRRIPVSPVRGQCCAMVSAKGVPPDTAFMSNYGAEYWRRAGDLVILGGFRRLGGPAEATHEEGVTGCLQSALAEFASARFPSLRGAPVSYRWSGIMAYTRDGLPLVGPLPGEEGLYFAGGYTGHGFGYAFVAARWLVELAFGGRDEIAPFCRLTRRMRPCPALHEI
jgi:glycine/D-amino acid oxidase-like deaminating enzyme